MNLKEWIINYVKFKDCVRRQIKKIEEKDDHIKVIEKKGEKIYCISENLEDKLLTEKDCGEKRHLVTLNTKKNVLFLYNNWKLVKDNDLTIIFANPDENEKWIIHTTTHNKISEGKSLKQGLITLYESITSC